MSKAGTETRAAVIGVGPLLEQVVQDTREALGRGVACLILDSRRTSWVRGDTCVWHRLIAGTLLAAAYAIGGRGRVTLDVGANHKQDRVGIAVIGVGRPAAGPLVHRSRPTPSLVRDYRAADVSLVQWMNEPGRFCALLSAPSGRE